MNPAAMTERLIDAAIYNEEASGIYVAGARKELSEARAAIETDLANSIVAPTECGPNCDDPECPYSHQPLTLRRLTRTLFPGCALLKPARRLSPSGRVPLYQYKQGGVACC